MRAAIYVRVSTDKRKIVDEKVTYEQSNEVQAEPLKQFCIARGWELYKVYEDRASGAKENRPGLLAMMQDAKRRLFDIVVVWRFDRFARSVKQLVNALEEFHALGINFVSYQEVLDTSTPMGRTMFTVIGAMAELERNIIRERIMAGIEHAKSKGTKSGKPIGRPHVVLFHRNKAREMRALGFSYRAIGEKLKIGETTARRICQNPGSA